MTFPFVIWLGKNPLGGSSRRLYRLVHRGPARENRPDDVPFSLEQRKGLSMMKKFNWGPPPEAEAKQEAIYALAHTLGSILMLDPKDLVAGHPLHCELNMAIAEGRQAKGCDCNSPPDPMDKEETP